MTPVWTIVSGKGGVGKSTLAASLAVGLAKRKLPAVLIDMDTGLRNQDMLLGLENRIMFDLVDVVDGSATLDQALVQDPLRPKLTLLSSSQIHEGAVLSLEEFRPIVDALRQRFWDELTNDEMAEVNGHEAATQDARVSAALVRFAAKLPREAAGDPAATMRDLHPGTHRRFAENEPKPATS